jgi:hypothetical protein
MFNNQPSVVPLAAFIHRGNGRSGGRAKMLNVGLHGRTSSAAALMAA